MKKIVLIILSLAMALMLTACGNNDEATSSEEQITGTVRYMNADPALSASWHRIADAYTEESGVPVEIVSSGADTYMTDLNYALNSDTAPVLFDIHNTTEFRQVAPICADLTGQKVLNQLITNAFSLSKDYVWNAAGNFGAVGYSLDSYGILVNRMLLEKAGYSFSDIRDLSSLTSVSSDIQNRKEELGIRNAFSSVAADAFQSNLYNACAFPALVSEGYSDPQFSEETQAQMQGLLNVAESNGPGLSFNSDIGSFINGETVFCAAYVNDYSEQMETAMGYENIGFIPLYCGVGEEEKQGLCTNAVRFWCVNSNASKEDQKAALDFVSWVAENEMANDILADEMGIYTPFVNAKTPRNPLVAIMYESLATRRNPMVNFLNAG